MPHAPPGHAPVIEEGRLHIKGLLGEGASGFVYGALLDEADDVAVKIFKGAATSDGLPQDEIKASLRLGFGSSHPCISPVLGSYVDKDRKQGLVFPLTPKEFVPLGNPPSFETVTRDTFPQDKPLALDSIAAIGRAVASACVFMHARGVSHGDLYAHNILANGVCRDERDVRPCDMGAATFYDQNSMPSNLLEKLEVRAFGCLLDDMLSMVSPEESGYPAAQIPHYNVFQQLSELRSMCMHEDVLRRPNFLVVEQHAIRICSLAITRDHPLMAAL